MNTRDARKQTSPRAPLQNIRSHYRCLSIQRVWWRYLWRFSIIVVMATNIIEWFNQPLFICCQCHPFSLAKQPSPHWKSQIAHSDMHHLAFGINFQIHFIIIIIISSVLSRFTSSFTCQLVFVIIPTLIIHHSFTPGSKPTFSTNPYHLNRLLLPIGLPFPDNGTGPDLSRLSVYF